MTTQTRTIATALPTEADHKQVEQAMMRSHDAVERIVWQLQDIASTYAGTGNLPSTGQPTLADVGALYEFTTSVESRAGELADFHERLQELLAEVAAMCRDGALRQSVRDDA